MQKSLISFWWKNAPVSMVLHSSHRRCWEIWALVPVLTLCVHWENYYHSLGQVLIVERQITWPCGRVPYGTPGSFITCFSVVSEQRSIQMPPYRESAKAGHRVRIVPRTEPARTQTSGQLNAVLKPFTFKVLNIQKSSSTPLIRCIHMCATSEHKRLLNNQELRF